MSLKKLRLHGFPLPVFMILNTYSIDAQCSQ